MRKNSVTILGAGLCGALLAIILARRGLKVTVLERSPDPRDVPAAGGRSINLAMSARGIRGLKYAGVFDRVEPLLVTMAGRCIHELDGSTNLHRYGQKETEVIYSVSRAELNRMLIDAAVTDHNVEIRFEQESVAYYPDEAVLRVRDLAESRDYDVKADPMIAADGAGSIVRRSFEAADVFGASEELIDHRYREFEIPAGPGGDFQMEQTALRLQQKIIEMGLGGNVASLIFSLKNIAKWSDKAEVDIDASKMFDLAYKPRSLRDVTPEPERIEAKDDEAGDEL